MSPSRSPKLFFQFADNVVDPTPEYDADNEELVLWGLSGLAGPGKQQSLADFKICLEQMLATLSDEDLNQLWSRSRAMIKYTDARLVRDLLETAISVVSNELKK